MRTPVTLAAFGAGLLLAFGAAWGVGATIGHPLTDSPAGAPSTQVSAPSAPPGVADPDPAAGHR